MKYIPVIISMLVLLIGGFLVADFGTKTIKIQNQIIETNLIELDK